jgi:Tfp pilus assembly protein PilX
MMKSNPKRQRGIALPVMLMIMLVMLGTSIFLIKSINSTTLTAGNLAYESALGRQADLGLMTAFRWLSATGTANPAAFSGDSLANGYASNYDTTKTVNDSAFWDNKVTLVDGDGTKIDYVIHRMCSLASAAYNQITPVNKCVMTTAPVPAGGTAPLGSSKKAGGVVFLSSPQVHYLITSRISGARGGHVVNQLVVLIGG